MKTKVQHKFTKKLFFSIIFFFSTQSFADFSLISPYMSIAAATISGTTESAMETHISKIESLKQDYIIPSKNLSIEKTKILSVVEDNNRRAGVALAKMGFYTKKIQDQKRTLIKLRLLKEASKKGWFPLWKKKRELGV